MNGSAVGDASVYTTKSTGAPELQLGWRHAFTNDLRMYFNASGVKKNGHLSGHIYDAALGLEWFPFHNLGFGAEYDYTRIKIDQTHHYFNDDVAMRLMVLRCLHGCASEQIGCYSLPVWRESSRRA